MALHEIRQTVLGNYGEFTLESTRPEAMALKRSRLVYEIRRGNCVDASDGVLVRTVP